MFVQGRTNQQNSRVEEFWKLLSVPTYFHFDIISTVLLNWNIQKVKSTDILVNSKNKRELLQSQAQAERELLGSSVIRTLEFGYWTFDLRMWTLDIRVWIWDPLLSLFRASLKLLLSLFWASELRTEHPRTYHDNSEPVSSNICQVSAKILHNYGSMPSKYSCAARSIFKGQASRQILSTNIS